MLSTELADLKAYMTENPGAVIEDVARERKVTPRAVLERPRTLGPTRRIRRPRSPRRRVDESASLARAVIHGTIGARSLRNHRPAGHTMA